MRKNLHCGWRILPLSQEKWEFGPNSQPNQELLFYPVVALEGAHFSFVIWASLSQDACSKEHPN